VAHLALAEAARDACGLDRIDLIVSRVALGKEAVERPRFADRLAVLHAAAQSRPWLAVVVTEHQLLADIAEEHDVLILGADKWAQVLDPAFYGGSREARDSAVARLPRVAIARRAGAIEIKPPPEAVELDIGQAIAAVSSSGARAGARHWMATEAEAFDSASGAWSDPDRYDEWITRH